MKANHLIVDSGSIIKCARLESLAECLYTTPAVIAEIKDVQSRLNLNVGYFVRNPTEKSIKFVTDFARLTGDLASLSTTDVGILALTVDIELEVNKSLDHLRQEPLKAQAQTGSPVSKKQESPDGWFTPAGIEDDENDGWITPTNKKFLTPNKSADPEIPLRVACTTTDYAMQNVLLQMGCQLLSIDGVRIKHLKTWVLRCHACFTVTNNMEKKFCPSCGGPTLMRTSTSIDAETGRVTYYLKRNFQYNVRGTVYALPTPKTGREENVILREDQKEFRRAVHKENRERKAANLNVFDPEYVPDFLSSRHSMKGSSSSVVIGYGKRNPNQVRK